jgi:hypothetical protein
MWPTPAAHDPTGAAADRACHRPCWHLRDRPRNDGRCPRGRPGRRPSRCRDRCLRGRYPRGRCLSQRRDRHRGRYLRGRYLRGRYLRGRYLRGRYPRGRYPRGRCLSQPRDGHRGRCENRFRNRHRGRPETRLPNLRGRRSDARRLRYRRRLSAVRQAGTHGLFAGCLGAAVGAPRRRRRIPPSALAAPTDRGFPHPRDHKAPRRCGPGHPRGGAGEGRRRLGGDGSGWWSPRAPAPGVAR